MSFKKPRLIIGPTEFFASTRMYGREYCQKMVPLAKSMYDLVCRGATNELSADEYNLLRQQIMKRHEEQFRTTIEYNAKLADVTNNFFGEKVIEIPSLDDIVS